jgi:hypothetical protein
MLFFDPIYRVDLGGRRIIKKVLLMAAGLVMAVMRLRHSRKIRRAAYEEVLDAENGDTENRGRTPDSPTAPNRHAPPQS